MKKGMFQVSFFLICLVNNRYLKTMSVDDVSESAVQQKIQEIKNKEKSSKIEQEALKRLDQERAKGKSGKSDNQLSPEDIKVSFDLVQKNILSDDQQVQRAALDLFFRLKGNLSQQQIQSVTSQLFDKRILQDLISDDSRKSNEARNLFDRIPLDLNETQKKQMISNLLEELAHQRDIEKTNYDKVGNLFTFLFSLINQDILKSSFDLKTLFSEFKKLLFREIQEKRSNEQLMNIQAKTNLQSTGQYPHRKNLQLLSVLDSLLMTRQPGMWSIGLNLENKQIFQLLFDIVQAVAQESDPEIKVRGLWMLGKMIKN